MLPLQPISALAGFMGVDETALTDYASQAILQATLQLGLAAQLDNSDYDGFPPDDQRMVLLGIQDMAEYIYLRQPYKQLIASPLSNESIGSYSYSKAQQQVGRNAAALELGAEKTGRPWYDLAYQFLAKRTRAGGVFSGGITVFEEGSKIDQAELMIRVEDNRLVLVGPEDVNKRDFPFDINAPTFPMDPSGF